MSLRHYFDATYSTHHIGLELGACYYAHAAGIAPGAQVEIHLSLLTFHFSYALEWGSVTTAPPHIVQHLAKRLRP